MIYPWKLLHQEVAYENKYVKIYKHIYELPNGKKGEYFIRDGSGMVASVVALTPDKQFIMAREFRPGPGKILDELPGGLIDPGEVPIKAAERELLEETGYKGEMVFLTETYLSAYSNMKKFCYLALDCQKIQEVENNGSEFIEVILKNKDEFLAQVEKGEMTDLDSALVALKWLEKNK